MEGGFFGALKYLIVPIFFGIAGLLIACGLMVLIPSINIFGLHYINGDKYAENFYYDIGEDVNISTLTGINVKASSWEIVVRPLLSTDNNFFDDQITVVFDRTYNGFVYGDVQKPEYIYSYNDNQLNFEVKEPQGLLSKVRATLTIVCPVSVYQNKDISINTISSNVVIGDTLAIAPKNLTVNAENGNVQLNNLSLTGELKINKKSGSVSSDYDLNQNTYINITDDYGKIFLKNIGSIHSNASLIMSDVKNSEIRVGNIYGDLLLSAEGGLVIVGAVKNEIALNTSDCKIEIESVGQDVDVVGNNGALYIKKANANVLIDNKMGRGEITFDEVLGNFKATTGSGAVAINKSMGNVEITTTSGNVNVLGGATNGLYIIRTNSGKATLNDIAGAVDFAVTNEGTGSVSINYTELLGENKIYTTVGNINISVKPNASFYLKSWNTAKSARFRLSGLSTDNKTNNVGASIGGALVDSADTLLVSSISGAIVVEQR